MLNVKQAPPQYRQHSASSLGFGVSSPKEARAASILTRLGVNGTRGGETT